jgi:DNA topoisomerase I
VRLLETTLVRVGNDEYARQNQSYGLTTLQDDHVREDGRALRLEFRGKGGKMHSVRVNDRRLKRIIRSVQDLPGQDLFQYVDVDGNRQKITSRDINDYMQEISSQPFTAKDFRTFAATVMAAWALDEFEQFDSQAKCKRNIRHAIESVARRLGNTAAVCRKSYVHPEVLNAYLDGSLLATLRERVDADLRSDLPGLRPEEAAVLAFLRTRLAEQAPATPAAEDVASATPSGPSNEAMAFESSKGRGSCVDNGLL